MSRAQQEIVQDLKRQLHDAEQEWQSARSRLNRCRQAVTQHQEQSQALKVEMQRLEDHAEALRDSLDKESAEDGGIESLRIALQEIEDERETHEGSYSDSVTAMNSMMQSLKEIRRELRARDDNIKLLQQNVHVAQSEKSRVEEKRRKILSDKNTAVARIENDKKNRDAIHEKREQAQARVLSYIQEASKISPRVPVDEGETTETLDQKLTRLKEDMQRFNRQ